LINLENLTDEEHLALNLRDTRNRALAHQVLFRHRHPDATPAFHDEIINLWHGEHPRCLVMAFREAGKSTIAEEAFVLGAAFRLYHNALILGANLDRAIDRLRAIKHEIEENDFIRGLYGELRGDVWNEAKVILRNGVCIQAFGRGQALRGVKHLQYRPDFCFADDIEEEEHVRDPAARYETLRWFNSVVIPALDKNAKIRVNATPLDRESLPMTLSKQQDWHTKIYPVEHISPQGDRQATWPGRYPLEWINEKKRSMFALGLDQDYMREYMCVAEDPARKIFTTDMIRVKPRIHVWQTTYAFYDPARTTHETSATTGWVVFSFIGRELVVWDGGAERWKPDELRSHIFEIDEQYRPAVIGIEEDGLHDYLNQPLRHEMLRRGYMLPVVPMKAPKGKFAFIEALQPHMMSGEVSFAKELPILRAQFLSYPTGRIDGPNALAYALRMRPGEVVYREFSTTTHVQSEIPVRRRDKCFLALNATGSLTTGVLVQLVDGALHVLSDYIHEGDPGGRGVAAVVRAAQVDAAAASGLDLFAGPEHFTDFNIVGLRGAVGKLPRELQQGCPASVGRVELRALLERTREGEPLVRVAPAARWTLNGFASGYAREVKKDGSIAEETRPGIYRTLMEGLEAFAGVIQMGYTEDHGRPNVQYTSSGQRYISALPGQRLTTPDLKGPWIGRTRE
jgi:hypothetical protein